MRSRGGSLAGARVIRCAAAIRRQSPRLRRRTPHESPARLRCEIDGSEVRDPIEGFAAKFETRSANFIGGQTVSTSIPSFDAMPDGAFIRASRLVIDPK